MPAPLRARCAAIIATILLALSTPAAAQFVERATFLVTVPNATSVDVDALPDGTWVVVYNQFDAGLIVVRRFTPLGALLGEVTMSAPKDPDDPIVAVDPAGGLVTAWRETVPFAPMFAVPGLFTRRVGADGVPSGMKIRVSPVGSFPLEAPAIAAVPTGSILTWFDDAGLQSRRFSPDGDALSETVRIDATGRQSSLLPTADGGHLIVYRSLIDGNPSHLVQMRAYGPTGALHASGLVSDGFDFSDAALAPTEDVGAAVGLERTGSNFLAADIVLRRFTPSGVAVGADVVVHHAPDGATRPQVEFDAFGNLFVAWGEDGAVWARALDPSGTPLAAPVVIGTEHAVDYAETPGVRTARLANGSFATAWIDGSRPWASVVTLCPPGSAVCGDGVYAVTCEGCDDGAANSDTAPDACRTNCRRAACGDGVVDSDETCDDGNTQSCDGCSATCLLEAGPVCGDGVVSPGCEECDDANGVLGDGCAACSIERVFGGGSTASDCYAEWRVDNPTNDPLAGKKGGMNPRQTCVDDDPRCDFDGGVPGGCTFHVAVCADNTNVSGCVPGERLLAWSVTKPTAGQASTHPALAAVRDAFAGVPAAIVGPGVPNVCSGDALVTVPLRGAPGAYHRGKLKLGGRAMLYTGTTDTDTLSLVCLPSAP